MKKSKGTIKSTAKNIINQPSKFVDKCDNSYNKAIKKIDTFLGKKLGK